MLPLYQYHVPNSNSITHQPVHQLCNIGVLVSCDLSWSPHIKDITSKARQKASWVHSVFHFHTHSTTNIAIYIWVHTLHSTSPRCRVASLKIAVHSSTRRRLVTFRSLSVQKTFTSRIAGMKHLHYWDRLAHLSLMSLQVQRRRERFILLLMWKVLHGKTSEDLNIQLVHRPGVGNLAVISSKSRSSSAANQTLFDQSFAVLTARPYKYIQ